MLVRFSLASLCQTEEHFQVAVCGLGPSSSEEGGEEG